MVKKWDVKIPPLTGERTRKAYIYLPDYYDEDKDATKGGPSLMEVHVAKNRHGDTGKVELSYYKATNIFREMFVK